MEWFVLTTVFTDQAYKSRESGGCKKKEKKKEVSTPKLCKRCSGGVEELAEFTAVAAIFWGGQSELHKRTLLVHLCFKAPEPANHCDSFDRVDNHR